MGAKALLRYVMVASAAAPTDEVPISGMLPDPWYQQTWNLFGLVDVPLGFIAALALLILAGAIYFIAQGYIQEVRRQRRLAAKAAAKKAKAKAGPKPKAKKKA